MVNRTITFTKEGLEKMKQEYTDLQEKRKTAVEELATARAMGDLSENAAYTAARRKLSSVDSRLRYLTHVIKNAVVKTPQRSDVVDIGATVTVDDGTQKRDFTIVGGHESDILNGKISNYTPIGRALMGKRVGDQVTIKIPAGVVIYTIIQISV